MLGVLGGDEDLPIERLALSGDHTTLASVSHESCLKLWDLTHLKDSGSDEEEAGQEGAAAQETEQPHQVCFAFKRRSLQGDKINACCSWALATQHALFDIASNCSGICSTEQEQHDRTGAHYRPCNSTYILLCRQHVFQISITKTRRCTCQR